MSLHNWDTRDETAPCESNHGIHTARIRAGTLKIVLTDQVAPRFARLWPNIPQVYGHLKRKEKRKDRRKNDQIILGNTWEVKQIFVLSIS